MSSLAKNGRTVCALLCVAGLMPLALWKNAAYAQHPSQSASRQSQSRRIGQYHVPDLPGWRRAIKHRPARVITRTYNEKTRRYPVPERTKAVYTRAVDGAELTLSLEATDAKRPVSAKRDILPGVQMGARIMAMMSGPVQKKTGIKPTPLPIKPETFRGQPAYSMTDTWTDPQGRVSKSRTRWFAGKTFAYEQEQIIKGVGISARAKAAANDGWQKLSVGLREP